MNDERPGDERWRDPIVEEVRAARQTLFAAAGNDIFEFCRRLREEQASSGHPVVTLARPSNRAEPGEAA
jgi:hypothetical protein